MVEEADAAFVSAGLLLEPEPWVGFTQHPPTSAGELPSIVSEVDHVQGGLPWSPSAATSDQIPSCTSHAETLASYSRALRLAS